VGELLERRAVVVEDLLREAHALVGERLLLLVAQLARAVGHLAAVRGDPQDVIDVPIAYSWTIARETSATLRRSSDAPVVTAPKTSSSAARPASSTAM
jgi:hypothetical protein